MFMNIGNTLENENVYLINELRHVQEKLNKYEIIMKIMGISTLTNETTSRYFSNIVSYLLKLSISSLHSLYDSLLVTNLAGRDTIISTIISNSTQTPATNTPIPTPSSYRRTDNFSRSLRRNGNRNTEPTISSPRSERVYAQSRDDEPPTTTVHNSSFHRTSFETSPVENRNTQSAEYQQPILTPLGPQGNIYDSPIFRSYMNTLMRGLTGRPISDPTGIQSMFDISISMVPDNVLDESINYITSSVSESISEDVFENLCNENDYLIVSNYSYIPGPQCTECSITLSSFAPTDEVCLICRCGHIFKKDAFERWINTSNTCPTCRVTVHDTNANNTDTNNNNINNTTIDNNMPTPSVD